MKLKKILALVLCIGTVLAMTACGSKEETIIAVTEPTYPPFESTDEDGNLIGFDIDLINAIAEDQGLKVEMQTMAFDSLIPAVESGQADMIIAGMSENPDRAEHVAFTNPYYDSGTYMIVKADSPINSEADIPTDAKIASQTGTVQVGYVDEFVKQGKAAKNVVLDQHTTAMLQLDNGDVDVVTGDLPVLEEYIKKHPDKYKLIGTLSTASTDSQLKMAVGLDNTELMEKLNKGLEDVVANGTYEELCKKWDITPMTFN